MDSFITDKVNFGPLTIKGKKVVSSMGIHNYLLLVIKDRELEINIGDTNPQKIIDTLKGEKT